MSMAGYFLSSDFRRSVEREQSKSRIRVDKRTLIIGLVAFITFCLSMSFGMRAAGDVGLTFQNGAKLVLWTGVAVWSLFEWRVIVPLLLRPAGYILSFLGIYAASSALWSPVPLYTMGSALGWISYLGLACLAIRYVECDGIFAALFWSLFTFIAISLSLHFIIPDAVWLAPSDVENVYRFVGLTDHPNNFGHLAGLYLVVASACASRNIISMKSAMLHGVIGITALILSGDRTIGLALLMITFIVAVRHSSIARYIAYAAGLTTSIILLFYASGMGPDIQGLMESVSRTGHANEILTLTGRTEIWSAAIDRISEKPIFGWGFNGTEQLMVASAPLRFFGNPVNAHEMFLQIALSLGIVGLIPGLALVTLPIVSYVRNPKFDRDMIVGLVVLNGLTEADIFATPVLSGFIFFWLLLFDGAPSPSLIYHKEA